MKSITAVKDPVCGMGIDVATAAGHTEYAGLKYSFCSSRCKDKFDKNPVQYQNNHPGSRTVATVAAP